MAGCPYCSGNRSIPACAGEPPPAPATAVMSKVYPRVCGGTHGVGLLCSALDGLSPRVRGNRPGKAVLTPPLRSIPACAGEPEKEQK